jgi:hypothetical protein
VEHSPGGACTHCAKAPGRIEFDELCSATRKPCNDLIFFDLCGASDFNSLGWNLLAIAPICVNLLAIIKLAGTLNAQS